MTTTVIRLIFDSVIQFILFLALAFALWSKPEDWSVHLVGFGALVSAWQVLHAGYGVWRYNDGQGARYLEHMQQILGYLFLVLGVSMLLLVSSFGFLFPFLVFVFDLTYWALCLILPSLGLRYFYKSLRNLWQYYRRPRSFWDL